MSDRHSFLSADSYSRSQAAEHMLNTALTQAKISESFEEYLEIFDKLYADDVQVSSENQHEPIRGKARVGSLLLNFLVPLHVMAEVGGLAISIKRDHDFWRYCERDTFCLDTHDCRRVR